MYNKVVNVMVIITLHSIVTKNYPLIRFIYSLNPVYKLLYFSAP